jgi:hypothetical protein
MLPQRSPAPHHARGAGAAPGGAHDLACTERPLLLMTGALHFFHGLNSSAEPRSVSISITY